ncbi:MAG: hypothetical protein QOD67_824 [Caballeronia sp.]|nr:hypothetical protein [Caballeronia sp.]
MTEGGVPFGRQLALHRERMALPDNSNKAIPEQCLHADFRTHFAQDTDLKVSGAVAQVRLRLLGLGRKTQTHERRSCRRCGDQCGGDGLQKPSLARMGRVVPW